MFYRIAADFLVIVHLAFILFVIFGGFSVLRDRRWALLHIPAVIWGIIIEIMGWICPLTPLENRFRRMGGEQVYSGDFIDHYLLPVIYPAGLTRYAQYVLATIVLAVNAVMYGYYFYRGRKTEAR